MTDVDITLWAAQVLAYEGASDWRLYVGPNVCQACCHHSTREIVVPKLGGHGLALLEIAHALKLGHKHDAHWRAKLAHLITEHTVPILHGPIGLKA